MATALGRKGKRTLKASARGDLTGNRFLSLRLKLGMPQRLFSRLVGASERSVSKFEKGEPPSESIDRQVTAVARLQEALSRVMKADRIGQWFQQPNEAFGGLTPLEVVERGEIDRLWAMVYERKSGTPA